MSTGPRPPAGSMIHAALPSEPAGQRHGAGHPLNSERRQARQGALYSRRHTQRGERVTRGRDRRSILRGF